MLTDERGLRGRPVAAVAADTLRAGARGGRADRRRVGGARAAARPGGGRRARVVRRRAAPLRARRRRRGLAAGGRRRRGRVPDADRPPQPARDAPGRVRVARRRARRLHLDAVRSGASATRSPRRSACRADKVRVVCEFMGGGFGAKDGAGRLHVDRGRARAAHRPARPLRALAARGERRRAATATRRSSASRAGARSDGTLVALGGEFVARSAGAAGSPSTAGPMQMLYACDNVRTVEYGAKVNMPPMTAFRAPGLRRGDVRPRVPARRARRGARRRPARAAPAELRRRRHDRRPAVLVEEPAGVLPPRRAALGAAGRGARALGRDLEARRRAGQPDLVRRRRAALATPGCASARTAARTSSPRCRTSAPARARRWRRSRPRSSGSRSTASRSQLGDSARGPYASISGGSSTLPSMGPAVRAAAADAARQILEIAAQRFEREDGVLVARGRAHRLLRRRLVAARGDHRAARRRTDPRQGRTRAEPGRHARAHLRRAGRRGRGRRRDGRGRRRARSPRSTTSAA